MPPNTALHLTWQLCVGFVALVLLCGQRPAMGEVVQKVTLCQLLADPAAYNHKLIEISGWISRGFEEFRISDRECDNRNWVWIDLGGTKGSEVTYCCNVPTDPERPSALVVEGIETAIVRDAMLERFDALTQRRGGARATVVGRYFSGTQQTLPGGTYWMGYGHMGMASLLVIQQVLAVQRR